MCIRDRYGKERVEIVLANTITHLSHDGRFSPNNKEWAKSLVPSADWQTRDYIVTSHPAVLDGFTNQARRYIERDREPEKAAVPEQETESSGQKAQNPEPENNISCLLYTSGQVVKGKFGAYCVKKCGMNVSRVMGASLTDIQVKDLLAGKKILLKGLKSKAGKPYDAYIIPSGTEEYHYTKGGEEKSGVQFKFVMEFPKKKRCV